MHPAILRFVRYCARQIKGICGAAEQMCNEIEREDTDEIAEARAASIKFPTPKLSQQDLEAIEKIVKISVKNGRE